MSANNFALKIKTAVAIAISAFALGVHMFSMAQSDANLSINGQIAAPTCLIGMQRSGGTFETAAAQTHSFGTVDASLLTVGALLGNTVPIVFWIRDSDGNSNCALVGNRWDIGLGIKNTDVVQTPNGSTFLLNQSTAAGAPKNIGLYVFSNITGATRAHVNLRNITPNFGVSLANNGAGATVTQGISTIFYLGRTSASAVTPGAFSVVIPLNIWYK
jgi:type 1 fimbria pilin